MKRKRISPVGPNRSLAFIQLPDNSCVLVSLRALHRRLVSSSPLLVLLQESLEEWEETPAEASVRLFSELPPHLRSCVSIAALKVLIEHLGSEIEDQQMMTSLEKHLSVPLVLHMYPIADWLLATQVVDRLTGWLSTTWLRDADSIILGASSVDVNVLRAVVRLNLFARASISEARLSEAASKRATRASQTIVKLSAEIDGLRKLAEAMAAEGAHVPQPVPMEQKFPVFIKFQGRSFVKSECNETTVAEDIKEWVANKIGLSEYLQRLEFDGKPIEDGLPLVSIGVRRDSTLKLALRYGIPASVQVRALDGQIISLQFDALDTVADVKTQIMRLEGIPLYRQRLFFRGAELRDYRRSLSDYNIANLAVLDLNPFGIDAFV